MATSSDTEVSLKFKNSITGSKKLEEYAERLNTIKSALSGINTGTMKEVDSSAKQVKNTSDEAKNLSKNLNLAFNYTAVRTFTRAFKNLFTTMSSMTSQSAAYLENMNLLDVAFNNNTTEATKFVNKLSEMYGLDESWGYRTVGIFKQLANAMGLSTEAGDKLSSIMTQFAIDTSSLYNIDTDDAVSILTSALAGLIKKVWLALNLLNCWNTL